MYRTSLDDPTCKKTNLDFERVIMEEKLSDLDINATQRIPYSAKLWRRKTLANLANDGPITKFYPPI